MNASPIGHGARFLALTMAALKLLAFAWARVQERVEPPFQAAREAAAKRTRFFAPRPPSQP